ncbi:MAG: hypothetical protein CR986_08495 [Ignavibacteriae bacterium]|nr:MAG: hypothetical protein CR986_08495 [Ignavibacteriota bacterium]
MIKKIIFMLILSLFLVNCSDDDNPVKPDGKKTLPEISLKKIELPQSFAESTNPYQMLAKSCIESANLFNNYSYMWTPPKNSNKMNKVQDEWIRTWKDDKTGLEVKLIVYDNDTEFGWTVYLSGNLDGITLTNQKVLEAKEIKATKSGSVKFFDFEAQKLSFSWEYSTDSNGVYTVNYLMYDEDENLVSRFEIISNPDGSGSVNTYEKSESGTEVLINNVTWNADGTGTWAHYDSSGNLISSGSF